MLRSIGDVGVALWSAPVPATPAWDVRDVVAHVTGIAVDAAAGALPAELDLMEQFRDNAVVRARDGFADGQVRRREGRTPAAVVAEWEGVEAAVVDRLEREAGDPEALPFGFDVVVVTDLCVHADDVAAAVGKPPHRDTKASRIALAGYCFSTDYRLRALELPALALRYDGKERILGGGPAAVTLTGDRWELLRVLAGRRSRGQIAALDWTGDPNPYLAVLPTYGERADDLIEGR